jgi:hypothetical protein
MRENKSGNKIFDPAPWPPGRFLGFFIDFSQKIEGYSADTCAEKFPLVSMGAKRRV